MVERIDYLLTEDFDIEFTEWNDIRTVDGQRVLTQNFVLLIAENSGELIGEQLTATKLSRFRKRLESAFRDRETVDSFTVNSIDADERTLSYDITIGSNEYEDTVLIP